MTSPILSTASEGRNDDSGPTGAAYTRFIILASERSGSSFLVQSLRSHPDIRSFGEIFNPRWIGFNTPGFDNDDQDLIRYRNRRPVEFLETRVFGPHDQTTVAVGFKLFYSHLERRRIRPLGRHLAGTPDLKVVHLRRGNLLRQYLSRVIASRTGQWGVRSPEDRQLPQVDLSARRCRRYFEKTRRLQEAHGQSFERCDVLSVAYEELDSQYEHQMERVQRFLGVEALALRARSVKHEVRPLAEAIRNYDALRAAFAGTPWAEHFDE